MTKRDEVLILLNSKGYTSGEEIGRRLGCSRSYVSKIIKELQADGIEIEGVPQKGYKLKIEIMQKEKIEKLLKTKSIARNLEVFEEIDSTNNYLKILANKGAPGGTCVISDCQTAGKGRLGRNFVSPKNAGIYYSVLLRDKKILENSQTITAAAAVAVAKTLDTVCGIDTKIKWVNDIYLNSKKLCGILTEGSIDIESANLSVAVVGIGINCMDISKKLPAELLKTATSIEAETGKKFDRNVICAELSNNLENIFYDLKSKKYLEIYRKKSILIGKNIKIRYNNKDITGKVEGFDDNASIIVKTSDGSLHHFNSGEAGIVKN